MNEEYSERIRRKLLSRFARERLDLSVSVEETLVAVPLEHMSWSDETGEQTAEGRTTQGKMCFPPRLSLQSRPIQAVHVDDLVLLARNQTAARLTTAEAALLNVVPPADRADVLAGFVRRLNMSFPENTESTGSMESTEAVSMPAMSVFLEMPASLSVSTGEESVGSSGTACPFPTLTGSMGHSQGGRQRQRLAGCTTKIHLETAPLPVALASSDKPRVSVSVPPVPLDKQEPPLRRSAQTIRATSARLPIVGIIRGADDRDEVTDLYPRDDNEVDEERGHRPPFSGNTMDNIAIPPQIPRTPGVLLADQEVRDTPFGQDNRYAASAYGSVIEAMKGRVGAATRGALSGSGVIESGQADVIVMNPYITAHSVVLITLTSNPGPVVVQYVSLQPQLGFTMHLTAPTTMKTTFNYIVLLGELF